MMKMLSFQVLRLFHSREYRIALVISVGLTCTLFILEVLKSFQLDRAAIITAVEHSCIWGESFGWSVFSIIWPFLVVLPGATSFVEEKKDSVIGTIVIRKSYPSYIISKVLTSGIGSAIVIGIPELINFIMCLIVFPHNHNQMRLFWFYGFSESLMGENRMFRSMVSHYPFLQLYLDSPILYSLLYIVILTGFSALCGAAITAVSFIVSKSKIALFVPLYFLVVVTQYLSAAMLSYAMKNPNYKYFSTYLMDYLAPMTRPECYWPYLFGICGILICVIVLCLRWALQHSFSYVQG